MKSILSFRNLYVRKRSIFLVSFLILLTLSQFPYLKESLNVGNYSKSPKVYSYQELNEALEMNGSARISTDFLQDTGIYLGLDDESVIEYTYSYTSFSKHFLIIAQEGSKDQQLTFENGPREFVVRRTVPEKHFDAHSLVINEFSTLLGVTRKSIEGEFYPQTLLLSTMRPHLQFSLYGMILVYLIVILFIYRMFRQVTQGIINSPNINYLDHIESTISNPISNTRNMMLIKDFLIYKPTLNFSKQSILLADIAIIGIKRWFHKFEVIICVDASLDPLRLYLSKSEIFILLETLKLNGISYQRDDSFKLIDSWSEDPYKNK